MPLHLHLIFVVLVAVSVNKPALADEPAMQRDTVKLESSDGVEIFGDLFELESARATILLFHQGGSNARAEYGPIIPRLLTKGFSVLAIDQRMGGQMYGQFNRTVAKDPSETSYCGAAPDLVAAAHFLQSRHPVGPLILWGSSYSAALALRLAASRPRDFAGVLAFSPASGGPMADCRADPIFSEIETPVLILRPASEAEIESVAAQLDSARAQGHNVFVARAGVHGSSMLIEERVGEDVEENWRRVEAFLDSLVE